MNRYGERFLNVNDFIAHCQSVNIRTNEWELEHYEKIGAMLPVARLIYPEDYFIHQRRHEYVLDPLVPLTDIYKQKYPELHRLTEKVLHLGFPHGFKDFSDEELLHCFDREIGSNPHLILPRDSEFKPWDDYKVKVSEYQGREIKESLAEHFYSYWQVHHLCWIQSYPDLYQNARLLELIPEKSRPIGRPISPGKERLAGFDGIGRCFDALSFWVTVYRRERFRTFANAAVVSKIRRIDSAEWVKHQQRLKELSIMVADRFNLSREQMYEFLHRLTGQYEKYESHERYKLASDLKMDIFNLERLIEVNTGEDLNAILNNVSPNNVLTLRRMDTPTRERDEAFRVIVRGAQRCTSELHELGENNWSFTESDVNELLDYCANEGLELIQTAMSGMVASNDEEEQQKFRYVELYSNLKNVLTSYEYLLKSLGERGQVNVRGTLGQVIPKAMRGEGWLDVFVNRTHLARAHTPAEFLDNLDFILNDDHLGGSVDDYWARSFLITLLARNCAVHSYPTEDRYYIESFGHMLHAPIAAMLFTWQLAKRRNWVET